MKAGRLTISETNIGEEDVVNLERENDDWN